MYDGLLDTMVVDRQSVFHEISSKMPFRINLLVLFCVCRYIERFPSALK